MKSLGPQFELAPGPHQARMEELVRKLWRDLELAPPSAQSPLAPVARVLDGCALNGHELPLLTRRLALSFLGERGIPIHGSGQDSTLSVGCAPDEDSATSLGEGSSELGTVGWDEPLAGFLFANEGGAAVFVRLNDPISRRRFSAAHELGHYMLHFVPQATQLFARRERIQYISGEPAAPQTFAAPVALAIARAAQGDSRGDTQGTGELEAQREHQQREAEADAFAAELLMPSALVSELARHERGLWSDSDLIWRLSQALLVSRMAMWRRLSQLGWVNIASPYNS